MSDGRMIFEREREDLARIVKLIFEHECRRRQFFIQNNGSNRKRIHYYDSDNDVGSLFR